MSLLLSRPLQAAVVALCLIVGAIAYLVWSPARRNPPASEPAASRPPAAVPAPQQPPAQNATPPQPKTEPSVPPEAVAFVGPPTPTSLIGARGGPGRSATPAATSEPPASQARGQTPPAGAATPPDSRAQIERNERTRQERAAQAQSTLTRAAGLHDTGDYDEALRAVDQTLALDASTQSREFRQRVVDAQTFERALGSSDDALTMQQIEPALRILSLRRLAGLVRARGTTFILDAEGERRFRAAIPAERADAALVDDVLLLLAPPRNPSMRTEWVAPTDRRRMLFVPGGTFQMGSPNTEPAREADETLHQVTIATGFWMESTEVTYRAFHRFVIANPEWQKNRIDRRYHDGNYLADWNGNEIPSGKDDAPVVNVSWYAARAYAAWAGKPAPRRR